MVDRKKREDVSETAHRIVGETIAHSEEPDVEVWPIRLHLQRAAKVTRQEKASS
jgi:hypothetical protein